MLTHQNISTKEKILNTSARLFANNSYDKISMRNIADDVGIKAASIYNHFKSKKDILRTLYKFYAIHHRKTAPDLNELLLLAETAPPLDVLMKLDYRYTPQTEEIMNQILVIAHKELCSDPDSELLIRKNIFGSWTNSVVILIKKMTDLGKIEPVDVKSLTHVLTFYTFSVAVLNNSSLKTSLEEWQNGLRLIFSIIKPTCP